MPTDPHTEIRRLRRAIRQAMRLITATPVGQRQVTAGEASRVLGVALQRPQQKGKGR